MDEYTRFILIEKFDTFSILYDKENIAFPYVLIDNAMINKNGLPETTQDLMEYRLRLFSSKCLLMKFLEYEGENEYGLRN